MKTPSILYSALILALLVLSTNTVAGKVYKWVDEQGNVHYSDREPNAVDAEQLRVQSGQQTAERKSAIEQDKALENQKFQASQALADRQEAQARTEALEKKCAAIQANLKILQENARARTDENGEIRYLTPDEINAKKTKFKNQLSEHCQG